MRYFPLLVWSCLSLAAISCDTGSSADTCGPGQERCGGNCVAKGSCMANLGGSSAATGGAPQKPIDTGPISSPDCQDSSTTSGKLTAQYSTVTVSASSTKQYLLSTNWWNVFNGQTVSYQGLSFTIGNPSGAATKDNNPIGFPTLYIGAYQGRSTQGSNLPKQVSALTGVPTVFSTNAAEGARDEYNATYDVWFTPTSAPLTTEVAPPKGGAYLMVWLFKPTGRQPRGAMTKTAHPVSGVEGTWNVWIDNTDPLCISYVATSPINGLAFDLNDFIQDSVTNKYGITSSMYLSIVFAGFEIWSGGDGLQVKNFCANVN